eukprot:m.31129 g.31129  ORF g.31129 m.31129 type:complete len:321 (-) comp4776_c0_seq1:34-996(-)
MNAVRFNGVTVEVGQGLDRIHFAVQFELVRLHDFLNLLTNVAELDVDTSRLDARVGGVLDGLEQLIVLWIEGDGPRTVNDAPVDVSAKVNLANVIVSQDRLVALVGCPVGSAVIERDARGKRKTSMKPVFSNQLPRLGFKTLSNVKHFHPRFNPRHDIGAHLTVGFRSLPQISQRLIECGCILGPKLFHRYAFEVVVGVLLLFPHGKLAVRVKFMHRNGRWDGLLDSAASAALLLPALFLLLLLLAIASFGSITVLCWLRRAACAARLDAVPTLAFALLLELCRTVICLGLGLATLGAIECGHWLTSVHHDIVARLCCHH